METKQSLGTGTALTNNPCHISAALVTILFVIQGLFFTQSVSGEIYQWRDAHGNIVYGDSPPSEVKSTKKDVRTNSTVLQETYEPPRGKNKISKEIPLRDIRDISVIFYMTQWCSYCKKTREYLQSRGIPYTEYDIDKDRNKGAEMKKKSGSNGIPVLDIEGIIVRGFNPNGISAAIESRRKEDK